MFLQMLQCFSVLHANTMENMHNMADFILGAIYVFVGPMFYNVAKYLVHRHVKQYVCVCPMFYSVARYFVHRHV